MIKAQCVYRGVRKIDDMELPSWSVSFFAIDDKQCTDFRQPQFELPCLDEDHARDVVKAWNQTN